LTARYERLRGSVLLRGTSDSYEAALVVQQGIPGWADFAHRFCAGERMPPGASTEDPSSQRPAAARPSCRREIVTVLASVILRCLETAP
jgi:hypothetical protein